jgi:hypothetical protein
MITFLAKFAISNSVDLSNQSAVGHAASTVVYKIPFDKHYGNLTNCSEMYTRKVQKLKIGMTGFEPAAPSSRTKFKKLYKAFWSKVLTILNNQPYQFPTTRVAITG